MENVKLNQRYKIKWQGIKLKETKEYITHNVKKEKRWG